MTLGSKTVPLESICDVFSDGDWIESKDQSSDGIRLIQTGNVGLGFFKDRGEKARYISEETFKRLKCQEVFKGDCLVSRLPDPAGRSCIIPDTGERMITAVDCTIIRFKKASLIPEFFNYYSQSSKYLRDVRSRCTGATRQRISRKSLGGIEVPFPSVPEQERIVAILDDAFAAIDQAIANTERNLANSRAFFESLLNSIFETTGDNWISERLVKVTSKIGSGSTPSGGKETYKAQGTSLIRSLNVHDRTFLERNLAFIDDAQAHKLSNAIVERNDVLFNITGASIARCCIVPEKYLPARVNQHVSILRPNPDVLAPDFLCYLLTSKTYKDALLKIGDAGSTRQAITKKQLEDLVVSFPKDTTEQKHILEKLDQISVEIQLLKGVCERKLRNLAELKQSLLQKAFSGELIRSNVVALTRPMSEQQHLETTAPWFAAHVLAYAHTWHASQQRDRTFGRVKAQKFLHVAESVARIDMGRRPIKDAAGPNDFQHMLRAEEWAKANLLFEFSPRSNGRGYDFKKLGNYNKLIGEALATVKPYRDKLEKLLTLIMPMDTREAEVLATVHAAWNNLLLDNAKITDDTIIHEARENWTESKKGIPVSEFKKAIATIRNNGIVPDGTAKRVIGQENLSL